MASWEQRLPQALLGGAVGALLGAVATTSGLSGVGLCVGLAAGSAVGWLVPVYIGRTMLVAYMAIRIALFLGTWIWQGPARAGLDGSGIAAAGWQVSLLAALAAAFLAALIAGRPWAAPSRRRLAWSALRGVAASLLLASAAPLWLLRAEPPGTRTLASRVAASPARTVADARDYGAERKRLRDRTSRLWRSPGVLRYPSASAMAPAPDGMSLVLQTADPLPKVVAYYERLLGRPFPLRPKSDGGAHPYYGALSDLPDTGLVFVYVVPITSEKQGHATRVLLVPE